jgi:mannosyltransferase OCH1-like enzyme
LTYLETWKKYCPDYEIIEWNENNFDINSCEYAKKAYENKKWAFVVDYVRFAVLEKE